MLKMMVQQLLEMEEMYPSGTCSYCLKKRQFLVELPCKHAFCAKCCLSLIKVTKIQKGLGLITNVEDDCQPVKCPKCNLVHMCDEDKLKTYAKVLESEAIREKVKKNHEVKLQGLFKTKEGMNSDAIPY